jgi:phosphonoacetaldehyde hydrolase
LKLLNPALPPNTVRASRLQAVVLDWAGTTVDFGSLAPARTLQKLFNQFAISLSDSDARRDMGLPKKDHLRAILALPPIREAWQTRHNQTPGEAAVEEMYQRFIPLQLSCLAEYSTLIPGVLEAVQFFRQRGLKIGSTTGYTRAMLDLLLDQSAKAGYAPDCSLAPEDVGSGRPHPFMLYETAVRLQVYPMSAIVKIGDTPADIHEALNAGAWSVGVAATGNGIGLAFDEFQSLSPSQKELRLGRSRAELQNAGAHFVIDTLAEANAIIDDIDARLASAAQTE